MRKAALIGVVLAAALAFGVAARAGETTVQGADHAPLIDLKSVRERPTAYQATPFKFDGQFYSIGTVYSPFYTVFEASRYINFSAWDDADEIWSSRGYTGSYPLLYLSRSRTEEAGKITKAAKFDRFRATAIVRATVGSYAFIEILAIEPQEKKMTPTALHHLIRAYRHKSAEEYDVAALHFGDAFDKTLPDRVLTMIRREEGNCYLATGQYEQAVVAFADAKSYDEDNVELKRLYDHAVALRTAAEERMEANRDAPQPVTTPEKSTYEPFDQSKRPVDQATDHDHDQPNEPADEGEGTEPPPHDQGQGGDHTGGDHGGNGDQGQGGGDQGGGQGNGDGDHHNGGGGGGNG